MTRPSRHQRARRGRVLVVGDDRLTAEAAALLLEAPVAVGTLFEALGEINAGDARRPFVALLVPGDLLPGAPARATEAIGRLDPSVEVIVVERDGSSARTEGAHTVRAPLEAHDLARLLGPDLVRPQIERAPERGSGAIAGQTASPGAAPRDASSGRAGSGGARRAAPPSAPAPSATAALPPPVAAHGLESRRSPEPAPARAVGSNLGDTDLVEAVMSDPLGVRETALALVRERTGWDDLTLAPPRGKGAEPDASGDAGGAATGASAAVSHDQRVFGRLITSRAVAREIEPWAAWLGCWLALDSAYTSYRLLAYRDDLTGAWNRRYFHRFLAEVIARASQRRRPVTVMVFDIDDFKRFNDEFDHEAGDVILRETVALLTSVIRASDRVCRIGGDEFAVIFADIDAPREAGSAHPESVEGIATRFQQQIAKMRFPKLSLEAPGRLTISGGLATYPWDGSDPEALLRLADHRALESKRRGKNCITFGPEGLHT